MVSLGEVLALLERLWRRSLEEAKRKGLGRKMWCSNRSHD